MIVILVKDYSVWIARMSSPLSRCWYSVHLCMGGGRVAPYAGAAVGLASDLALDLVLVLAQPGEGYERHAHG